jgi:hypothetical protein
MDQMWDNWHVKQVLLDNWNHLQRNTYLLRGDRTFHRKYIICWDWMFKLSYS